MCLKKSAKPDIVGKIIFVVKPVALLSSIFNIRPNRSISRLN